MSLPGPTLVVGVVGVLAAWAVIVRDDVLRRYRESRAQAEMVAAWVGATSGSIVPFGEGVPEVPVTVANGSAVPVYQAVVFVVAQFGRAPATGEAIAQASDLDGSGDRGYRLFAVLPPGRWVLGCPWSAGMLRQPIAEIAFTDAAGLHWIRRASGELHRLPGDPVSYFRLDITVSVAAPRAPSQ